MNLNYKKAETVLIPPPYLFPTYTTKATKIFQYYQLFFVQNHNPNCKTPNEIIFYKLNKLHHKMDVYCLEIQNKNFYN